MDSPQIALEVAAALDEQQIPYMLVGSFSSNVYGVPRSTRDADFVIQHPGLSFKQLMLKLGPRFIGDPQLRFEGVTGTTRQIIELADHTFKVELFRLTDDPDEALLPSVRKLLLALHMVCQSNPPLCLSSGRNLVKV